MFPGPATGVEDPAAQQPTARQPGESRLRPPYVPRRAHTLRVRFVPVPWSRHWCELSAAGPLSVVAGRRERRALALDQEFVLVFLAADLGPLLLVLLGVTDVGVQRRRIGRRRHVVGVERIEPGLDAFVLGRVGQRVIIEVLLRHATVHVAVLLEETVGLF